MTGIPEYNRAAFIAAEVRLRALGLEPVNPWGFGAVSGWDHYDYMRRDIPALATCEAIHMLPGWLRSRGARKEWAVARVVFGMRRLR
jgi:hypothetical protein